MLLLLGWVLLLGIWPVVPVLPSFPVFTPLPVPMVSTVAGGMVVFMLSMLLLYMPVSVPMVVVSVVVVVSFLQETIPNVAIAAIAIIFFIIIMFGLSVLFSDIHIFSPNDECKMCAKE